MPKDSNKSQKNHLIEGENAVKEKSEKNSKLKSIFKNIKTRVGDVLYNYEADEIMTLYKQGKNTPQIYRKGGKYGMKCAIKDDDGKITKISIDPKYDSMYEVYFGDTSDGLYAYDYQKPDFQSDKWYAVVRRGNKKGLIDFNGNEVIELKYDDLSCTMGDKFMFKVGDKRGMMDKHGKVLMEPKYSGTYGVDESIRAVKIGDHVGLINKEGKEIVEPKYDNIYKLHGTNQEIFKNPRHTRFVVEKGNKKGLVDNEGKEILESKYDDIMLFYPKEGDSGNGVVVVKLGDKYGLLSTVDGSTILDTVYGSWHQNFPNLFSSDPEKNDKLIFKNKETGETKVYWRDDRKNKK